MSQRRQFTLNTEPHVAEIGDVELLFQPEVTGAAFLDAYEGLQHMQKALGVDLNNLGSVEPSKLRAIVASLRTFLADLMVPVSAETFARWDVVENGTVVESFASFDEATAHADSVDGAKVVDEGMQLPDRVLVQLLEWVVELYGGGADRPTGSSGGSAAASPPPGTRGRAASPSRASTRAAGR